MILKKIEINNIRAHSNFVFEPAETGITVLSGENGKGKSTILDSFAWALFGTRLHNLKNKCYIKDGVNPKNSQVSVEVILELNNREYKIIRTIINDKGASECNIYSRELGKDTEFTFECGPSITHSEKHIRELIKGSDKSFFLSTFIKQKEVDKILDVSGAERGKVIEELIGVSAIQNSIQISKDESKSLNKALSVIKVGDTQDLELEIKELKNQYKATESKLRKLQEHLSNTESEQLNQEQVLNEAKDRLLKFNEITQRMLEVNSVIKATEEQLSKQLEIAQNYKGMSFDEKLFDRELKKQEALERFISEESTEIELKKQTLRTLSTLFSHNLNSDCEKAYIEADTARKENEIEITKLEVKIPQLEEEIENLRVLVLNIKKGSAECPICKNPISDKCYDEYVAEGKKLTSELSTLKSELSERKSNSDRLLQNTIKAKQTFDIYVEQIEKKPEYEKLKTEILELETRKNSHISEKSILATSIENLRELKKGTDEYKLVKHNIKDLNENLGILRNNKESIESELIDFEGFSQKTVSTLEKTFSTLSEKLNKLKIDVIKTDSELALLKEKGTNAIAELKKMQEAHLKYTEITNQMNDFINSAKVLTDFKELRIAESIPVITEIASDIISHITDGKIDKIDISPKFDISVVMDTGHARETEALSGGEKSSVAIALRLAISLFLRGNGKGLIVLDEVLVSLSEHRASLVLDIIKNMTDSQVIMISHSSNINSFADKVVNL